jgi:hypothetical protein
MAPLTFKESNMEKLTHPIELSGEELDLVAAGWNNGCGCGGDRDGSLVNIETGNINILSGNNVNVSAFSVVSQST